MKPFAYVLGCSVMLAAAYEVHSAAAPADLHYLMKNVVAVQTQVIWDLGNRAQDDQGNPDASKLAAADWTKIMDAATKVRQASQTLARADHVLVAAPGVKIEGEGNPGALGAKQSAGSDRRGPCRVPDYVAGAGRVDGSDRRGGESQRRGEAVRSLRRPRPSMRDLSHEVLVSGAEGGAVTDQYITVSSSG
jgi:hypothetical protein